MLLIFVSACVIFIKFWEHIWVQEFIYFVYTEHLGAVPVRNVKIFINYIQIWILFIYCIQKTSIELWVLTCLVIHECSKLCSLKSISGHIPVCVWFIYGERAHTWMHEWMMDANYNWCWLLKHVFIACNKIESYLP